MKHYFKSCILVLFSTVFLVLLSSCEEENFIPEQATETETEPTVVNKENPLLVREVSQADIPNVLSKIKGKMSSAAKFYDNKIEQDDIQVYLGQVKEAVKKGQHSNYTFPIHVEGAPLTELYVLGIDKYIDGTIGEPIVTKYELSQESYDYFLNENDGIVDFKHLKADYTYYTFDEFFSGKANKSPDCQGTMGAGPGYYPTTEPGGVITNSTTVTGITVGFHNTVINTTTYVYTSNVPNGNGGTSSVSTLATSGVITTTTEPTGDTSGEVPDATLVEVEVPENTDSVTQDVPTPNNNNGGGAGCTYVFKSNGEGGSWELQCPQPNNGDNNVHSYKNRTPNQCLPFDYSAINTIDLVSAQLTQELGLPFGWLNQNREFRDPLKNFKESTGPMSLNLKKDYSKELAQSVVNREINEVEGLQALQVINQVNEAQSTTPIPGFVTYYKMELVSVLLEIENDPVKKDWCNRNPRSCMAEAMLKASKEMAQYSLDALGLVPVIGEICDILNGVIYSASGEFTNASLSFAAAIPFAGWGATASKLGLKVVDNLNTGGKISLKIIKKTDGLISFGDRGQLSKVLGLKGTGKQAHHMVPWKFGDHPLIQKAANSKEGWHMNQFANGLPLNSSNHLNGHSVYSDTIEAILNRPEYRNLSGNEAHELLNSLGEHIRRLNEQNPALNLGQLSELINFVW